MEFLANISPPSKYTPLDFPSSEISLSKNVVFFGLALDFPYLENKGGGIIARNSIDHDSDIVVFLSDGIA